MKLLVFAHTPPPHHGQSYMVRLMLDGFGGDQRRRPASSGAAGNGLGITCYHVNARVSKELEDIGDFRLSKLFLLFAYCVQAIWCRFRYGVRTLYYIPAPGKHSALYRDWMVMFLCRPFYKRIILHWHAAGLAKWLETSTQFRSRAFTYNRLKDVDLSIVLSRYNRADAEKLFPQRIRVVSNGIPDPCPAFEREILPRRRARQAARKKIAAGVELDAADHANAGSRPEVFQVLYLAHCTREKGLFDCISGVLKANEKLAAAGKFRLELRIAGNFVTDAERDEFNRIAALPECVNCIHYFGFISGAEKDKALREADLFCFPTYYQNENQPVNLIEAMAYGLPIITTRWRSLPELLPAGNLGLVDICAPEQIADALVASLTAEASELIRELFLRHFTLEQYLAGLAAAFESIESANDPARPSAFPVPASTPPPTR
jgi:glycosyltransferase involved in cell wall biosynthesis